MKSWKSNLWLLIAILLIAIVSGVLIYPNRWGNNVSPWRYGLDLAGGTSLIYNIDMSSVAPADYSSVAAGLRDVIQKRIDLYGVSDAQVTVAQSGSSYQLLVDLPGVKNLADAVNQIGELPTLQFALLEHTTTSTNSTSSSGLSLVPTQLTGRYITDASVSFDSNNNPGVTFDLNGDGSKIFSDVTSNNIGQPLCILIDGDLIFPNNPNLSCPTINNAITNGQAQINGGGITVTVAQQIAERFNAGALAAPIKLVNEETVSATAADNAMHQILFAGAIGTLAVILFMILSYRSLGVFASVALLIYTSLSLGVFKFLIPGFTLTLAGIAGFILSIGMAVDANILIFERSKEELKKGLSWHAAIEEGFHRAWPSIRDSNISTIITSTILYFFTSSFVQGFALTLGLGVIISMFSAIFVTRTMLEVFIKK